MGFFEWAVLFLLANVSLGISLLPTGKIDNPEAKAAIALLFFGATQAAWFLSGAMVLWSVALWIFGWSSE